MASAWLLAAALCCSPPAVARAEDAPRLPEILERIPPVVDVLPPPAPTVEVLPRGTLVEKSCQEMPGEISPILKPWWMDDVLRPQDRCDGPLAMSLNGVILGTLVHSPQVRVLSDTPLIRTQSVIEAAARFDARTFVESRFVDTNDPVGSTLTTGGASRFIDQNWTGVAGFRRRSLSGSQFEASQRFGYEDNNSIFFVPTQQGTARMSLSLTQPLLNGAGIAYNSSMTVLAEIDVKIARDQFSRDLQALLVEVYRTYWDLHLQRAVRLQKQRLYREAVVILEELEARTAVDVPGSQLVRARAAVAMREAALIRYATSVRNVESKLLALINDPVLVCAARRELVPTQPPLHGYYEVTLCDNLILALQHRPEINAAARELRAASIRAEISKNELMPVLNAIVGTYVSGLQGQSGVFEAWGDQFSTGRPTYSGGLAYELPYGNQAARARFRARRLELRQITNQLQTIVANIRAEVEIAVREVGTTYREMASRQKAMAADQAEIDYLTERWRLLPGEQTVAGVVLDDVLKAQERLADASYDFAAAQMAYNMSLVNLKRVTGTLLDCEEIGQVPLCVNHLPTLLINKNWSPAPVPGPVAPVTTPAASDPPFIAKPPVAARALRAPKLEKQY